MKSPNDFKMVPDPEELELEARDLQFFPATGEDLKVLTPEQVKLFNQNGFLKGIPIFSGIEMAELRGYFDRLLEGVMREGKDSYSISSAHLKYGRIYDLLAHPKLVRLVADLLGPNVVGWGAHFFCKMPGDGKKVAWHQDASYWPLTPSRTVTVWLAVDDADRGNACMQFLAGSHLYGAQYHRPSRPEDHNVLNTEVAEIERFGKPVLDELKAGEISLHSDLLLHGSERNESNRRRCGLTLRYCATEVRAYGGWNAKGVVLAGTAAASHWANPSRPECD